MHVQLQHTCCRIYPLTLEVMVHKVPLCRGCVTCRVMAREPSHTMRKGVYWLYLGAHHPKGAALLGFSASPEGPHTHLEGLSEAPPRG